MTAEMPTKLIRKNPDMPLLVVSRASHRKLMNEYTKLLSERDDLRELVDLMESDLRETDELLDLVADVYRPDETEATDCQGFFTEEDYEPGCLKVNVRPGTGVEVIKPKKRKKFAGASIEFDPFKRTFGLGLHFKEVED